MAGPSFPHLFSPFEIRGLTFKNRIFSPAHGTSLGDNGKVGEDLIRYHEARARGGAGLIILEGMNLHSTFSFPSLADIEAYVMKAVMQAGSQHCPPVIIGVGIGGSFDVAAKIASKATYRAIGSVNPEPVLAAMEERLLRAVNATGFGPMGTGGDTTALAVHVDYSAGHGYTPVAVCFNCWINRRTRARIHADGSVERME